MVQYCCAAVYKGLPVSFNNVKYIKMNDIYIDGTLSSPYSVDVMSIVI